MTSCVSLWIPVLLVSISVVTGQTTHVAGSTTPPLPETTPARISTTAIVGSQQQYSQVIGKSSMPTQIPPRMTAGLSSFDANGSIYSDGFPVNHSTSIVKIPDTSMQPNTVTSVVGAVSSGQNNAISTNVIQTLSPTNVVSMYVSSADDTDSYLSGENSTLQSITLKHTNSSENLPSVSTMIGGLDNDTAILLTSTTRLDNAYSDSVQMLSDSNTLLSSVNTLLSTIETFESVPGTSSVYSQTALSQTAHMSSNTAERLSIKTAITDMLLSSVDTLTPTKTVVDSTVSFIDSSISLPSLNTLKTPLLASSFLNSIYASDDRSTSSEEIKPLSSLPVIPSNSYSTFTTMENSALLTHIPVSPIASYSDVTSDLQTEIISSDSIEVVIASVNISSSYSSSTVSTLISESLSTTSTTVMPSTPSFFSSSDGIIIPDTDTILNASSMQDIGSISLQTSTSFDSSSISNYISGSVNTNEVITTSSAKFSYNLSESKSTLPISELPQNSLIITPTLSIYINSKSGDVSSMIQLSPSSVVVSDGIQSTSVLLMNTSYITTDTANVKQHTQSANLDTSFSTNIQKSVITKVLPTIYSSRSVLSPSLPSAYSGSFLLPSTFVSEISQYLSVSLIDSALPPIVSLGTLAQSASGWSIISQAISTEFVSTTALVSTSSVSSISEPIVTLTVLSRISAAVSEGYSVATLMSFQSASSVNTSTDTSLTMMRSSQSSMLTDISTEFVTLSTNMVSSVLAETYFSTTDFGSSTNHSLSVPLATIEPSISMVLHNSSALDLSTEIVSTEDLMFYTSSVFGKSDITSAITMSTDIETVSSLSQHASSTTNTISNSMPTLPRGISPTSIPFSRITPRTSMHLDTSYSEIPDSRSTDLTYSTSPVLSTSQYSQFVAPVNSISANSEIVLSTVLSSSLTPSNPQPITESIYPTVVQETLNTNSPVSLYTDFVSQSSYDISGLNTSKLFTSFTSSLLLESVDTLSSSIKYDTVYTPSFKELSTDFLKTRSSVILESDLSHLYSTIMQYSSTRVVSEELLSSHKVYETMHSLTSSSIAGLPVFSESEFISSLTVITSISGVTSMREVPSSLFTSVDGLLSATANETIYQNSATIIDSYFTVSDTIYPYSLSSLSMYDNVYSTSTYTALQSKFETRFYNSLDIGLLPSTDSLMPSFSVADSPSQMFSTTDRSLSMIINTPGSSVSHFPSSNIDTVISTFATVLAFTTPIISSLHATTLLNDSLSLSSERSLHTSYSSIGIAHSSIYMYPSSERYLHEISMTSVLRVSSRIISDSLTFSAVQTSAFTSSVVQTTAASSTTSVFTPSSTALEPSSLFDITTVTTKYSSLRSELVSTTVILVSPVVSSRTLSVFSIDVFPSTSDFMSTSESLTPLLTDSIHRKSSSIISISRSQEISSLGFEIISGSELLSTSYGMSFVFSISPTETASVSSVPFVKSASKDTGEYLSSFSTVLLSSPTISSTYLGVMDTKIYTSPLFVSVASHSISVLESESKMTTLFTIPSTSSQFSTIVLDSESTSPTETVSVPSVSIVASASKSEDTAEHLSSFLTVFLSSQTFSSTHLSILHTEIETSSLYVSVDSHSISVLDSKGEMTTSFTYSSTPLLHSTTVLDSESIPLFSVVSKLTSLTAIVLDSSSLSTVILTPTLLSSSASSSTFVSTPTLLSTSVRDGGSFSKRISTPILSSRSVLDSEMKSAIVPTSTPISTSVLASGSASSFTDVSSLAPSSTAVLDSETTTPSSRFDSTFTPPLSSRQSLLSPVDSTIDASSIVSILDTSVVLPTSEVVFSEANLTSTSMDTGNMTVVPTRPLDTVSMSISASVSGNVTVASIPISATASAVVPSSSVAPTTQKPPNETTLNATNAEEPYWVRTVMKIRRSFDVTMGFFKADLERRLAMAFNEAFIRLALIQQGRFEFLKRRRRRKRFTTVGDASVHVREVSREAGTSSVSAVYTVEKSGQVLTATDAVAALNSLDTQEVAILLQQVLQTKAEPFLTVDNVDKAEEDSKLWLIAAIVGPIVAFLIFVWVMLCIYFKCPRGRHRRGSAAEPKLMAIEQTPEKHQKTHLSNVKEGPSRQDKMGSRGTLGSKVRAYEVEPTSEPIIIEPNRQTNSPPTLAKTIQNGTILKDTPLSSPKTSLAPPKPKRARKTRRNSVEPLSQGHMPSSVQTSPSASHAQMAPPLGHHDDTKQLLQSSISDDNEDLQQRARIERRRNKDRLREKRMKEREKKEQGYTGDKCKKERGEDRRVADFVTSQNHLNALGLASTSLPSVNVERYFYLRFGLLLLMMFTWPHVHKETETENQDQDQTYKLQ